MAKKKAKTTRPRSDSKASDKKASSSSGETITWITAAMKEAVKSGKFCVGETLPPMNPQLHVAGVGEIKLPLKPKQAKELLAAAHVAPFGKGTRTLVDPRVRKTFEFDASQIELSPAWNQMIDGAVANIAEQLGLEGQELSAELYKLLLYVNGGHFKKHRDSEKNSRMVASLIVMLPGSFSGGELIVRHRGDHETFSFPSARNQQSPELVAFYADCEHEVSRVTGGRRLCLTYNLTVKKTTRKNKKAVATDDTTQLANLISSHTARQPDQPLVFALEHQYTEAGLKAELLKGTDRNLAQLVESAAEQSGCRVYLAQVVRHLLQDAFDGNFGYSRWERRHRPSRHTSIADLEIGDTHEDDLSGNQWRDYAGKRQSFGAMPFDSKSIISQIPLDQWKPTEEEYEGYTGNAGNTLDRWYHRSAIVLWSDDHHFDVLARGNFQVVLDMYLSMHKKLAKTPKKRLDQARDDCLRLARAIARRWPAIHFSGRITGESQSSRKKFIETIPDFENKSLNQNVLSAFLRDRTLAMSGFVIKISRQHGVDWVGPTLKTLLGAPVNRWNDELMPRDVDCLLALCCDPGIQNSQNQLRELCDFAVNRFCELMGEKSVHHRFREESQKANEILVPLLQSCLAMELDETAERLIRLIQKNEAKYTVQHVQVPVLSKLIPWSQKHLKKTPDLISKWREAVVAELTAATTVIPPEPADWTRPAKIEVSGKYDRQLNDFLADPYSETLTIAAAEYMRQQIIDTTARYRCDLSHRVERKGSPHQLVLTKTTESWKRAVQQYKTDVTLLEKLTSLRTSGFPA